MYFPQCTMVPKQMLSMRRIIVPLVFLLCFLQILHKWNIMNGDGGVEGIAMLRGQVLAKTKGAEESLTTDRLTIRARVEIYLSTTNEQERPLPPHTPGAFIHVGKTGGSTLSGHLINGCHSFVPKPCGGPSRNIMNESYISKTTTYIHTPDFPHRVGANYSFFVVTTRDPFSRALSTFTYQHPNNRRVANAYKPVFKCFPTLETFTEFIGDDPDAFNYTVPITSREVDSSNCTNLARAIMKNRVPASNHFYWDLKTIMSKFLQMDKVPILMIRTEHIWEDWTSTNLYLGQSPPVATFPEGNRTRDNFSGQTPNVTKDISDKGRERLCRALKENYRVYLRVIYRSVNLTPEEKQDSLALARKNCPSLELRSHQT